MAYFIGGTRRKTLRAVAFFLLWYLLIAGALAQSPVTAVIYPEKVIALVGEPITVNCVITSCTECDSSQLYFSLASATNRTLDTSRLDNRTLQFRVTAAGMDLDDSHLHCYLRTAAADGDNNGNNNNNNNNNASSASDQPARPPSSSRYLASSSIHVGEPPGPIRDFQCISPNWERMICTWNCSRQPGHAGVGDHFVNYQLNYTLDPFGRVSWQACPTFSVRADDQCQCSFDEFYENFFREEMYGFRVHAWSRFGEQLDQFQTKTIEIVRPDPVDEFKIVARTATTLTLKWSNPRLLEHTIRKLTYQLRYHSDYDTKIVNFTDCSNCAPNVIKCYCHAKLVDLVPYTNYTLSVRCITQAYPRYWSAWKVNSTRTAQSLPVRNPETSLGGYIADIPVPGSSFRDIDLYFKDVPHYYLHGELTDLRVYVHDLKTGSNLTYPCDDTMHLRYCKIFQLQCSRSYRVELKPRTLEGYGPANATSYFHLQPCHQGPASVKYFIGEISATSLTDTTIHFTWTRAQDDVNQTLYYCASTTCEGGVQWVDIPSDQSEYNMTIGHTHRSINDYKFALATNNEASSKGMGMWMPCLYDWNGEPGLPVIRAGADELQSSNSLSVEIVAPECQKGTGYIRQYRLHYSPVNGAPEKNVSVVLEPFVTSYRITKLHALTQYSISLTVMSRAGDKQVPSIVMSTLAPPAMRGEVVAGITMAVLVFFIIVLVLVYLGHIFYRKITKTSNSIKPPEPDVMRPDKRFSGEELLDEEDLMSETSLIIRSENSEYDMEDETQRRLLPNGHTGQNRAQKQRSHDSGNSSLQSDVRDQQEPTDLTSLSIVCESNAVPIGNDPIHDFVRGPDDYVLHDRLPIAYENRHYNAASLPLDGDGDDFSWSSSAPVTPRSDSDESVGNDASQSSQTSQNPPPKNGRIAVTDLLLVPIKKLNTGESVGSEESDSYWQVAMKQLPADNAESVDAAHICNRDDNGNTTPVNLSTATLPHCRDRDNGYGSTTPNDVSLTMGDSDTGSQYSLDSGGHSLNSNDEKPKLRFPSGPMCLSGDYVIRPDSLEPCGNKRVNSCGESSDDSTDNSLDGADSYAKIGLSPEAIDTKVLGLATELTPSPVNDGDGVSVGDCARKETRNLLNCPRSSTPVTV